jgi:NAD(P)-dependent dehydrogenase (short-subunit alcohol dehydrogenase family)
MLVGRAVLVTGANRGMGREYVRRLLLTDQMTRDARRQLGMPLDRLVHH